MLMMALCGSIRVIISCPAVETFEAAVKSDIAQSPYLSSCDVHYISMKVSCCTKDEQQTTWVFLANMDLPRMELKEVPGCFRHACLSPQVHVVFLTGKRMLSTNTYETR